MYQMKKGVQSLSETKGGNVPFNCAEESWLQHYKIKVIVNFWHQMSLETQSCTSPNRDICWGGPGCVQSLLCVALGVCKLLAKQNLCIAGTGVRER